MKKWSYSLVLVCLLQSTLGYSWNGVGHRLTAKIAYAHLTPHAKRTFNFYNQALDKQYKPQNFVNASVWLDNLRYRDVDWFNNLHYINLYFSDDGTPLPALQPLNAIWGIETATHTLLSPRAGEFDKGVALRILLHVTGDLHQPMHAVTRVSSQYPLGDRGGNLFRLNTNPVAKNLHSYWDSGAGLFLLDKQQYSQLTKMAADIEKKWPCDLVVIDTNPKHWSDESHHLALTVAYKIAENSTPSEAYQQKVQAVAEQRVALAGCRLAALLNQIDGKLSQPYNYHGSKAKPSSYKRHSHRKTHKKVFSMFSTN